MSYLDDYLLFNSNNECPRNYHIGTALFTLAAANGLRCWVDMGYFDIRVNLYLGLIGKQGSRKTTAKDIGRSILMDALPDTPLCASVQSMQDLVKRLASDECLRAYQDEHGNLIEWKPMTAFVNELKNFLSINPSQMLDFLTDIYDRKVFDASTIKHGLQVVMNPCLNFLACETPKWIIDKLKLNIITGGFARRIIYIYELDKSQRIPFPMVNDTLIAARQRCVKHLKKVATIAGQFKWSPEGRHFYESWYRGLKPPDDEVMEGYYESKHTQLLKFAMLLALGEDEPKLVLTRDFLELGLAILDTFETNMPKLSVAAGRNELAVPMQRILELLEKNAGAMPEKKLLAETSKDLTPMEQISLIRHLCDTDQCVRKNLKVNGVDRVMIMTKRFFDNLTKNGSEQ